MNLDEHQGLFCVNHHLHLAITLQPTNENIDFHIFVTSDYHSFISKNLKHVGHLGQKIDF